MLLTAFRVTLPLSIWKLGSDRKRLVENGLFVTGKQLLHDSEHGHLYWCDPGGMRVLRAKEDGSDLTVLVQTRNRLAHHEAIWEFQEEDASGNPDYSRPVYGLNASLHLLRRSWADMLEALSWISPERYAAFLSEGHHLRFESFATLDGLYTFTGRHQISQVLKIHRKG